MSISREHEMYLERQQRDRDYELREEQREKEEAENGPHMTGAQFDAWYAANRVAEPMAIAEPVAAALNGWLAAVAPKPRYAAIGNGLFVRVGTGKKRRAA